MDLQKKFFSFHDIKFTVKALQIKFFRNFTTAHSSSASRINFIVQTEWNGFKGYGQCGLPPKKPKCYLADLTDCFQFAANLENELKIQQIEEITSQFQDIPQQYMIPFRKSKIQIKNQLLYVLKIFKRIERQQFRSAKTAFQFSLFSLWSEFQKITMSEGIFNEKVSSKISSFYTLSYEEEQKMVENARSGTKHTNFIKIKFTDDISSLISLLCRLEKQGLGKFFIIDANACWQPKNYLNFVKQLSKYEMIEKKIVYIEQPYDINLSSFEEWVEIKKASPFKILADQSFSNEKDISKIIDISHAVNIKTEKAGGVLNSLRAAMQAEKRGLEVMFGSMCSTQLGCAQTFQFHPLVKYMDVDGSLLVETPAIQGGFKWKKDGYIEPMQQGYGLQVNCTPLFDD